MLDMTSCSRGIGSLAVILGVLVAFSGTACNSGPTQPSEEDRIALYTGKWRGNINAFEVILDVRTDAMDLLWLNGAGTARNTATGEMHRLTIFGAGQWGREWEQGIAFLNIDTAREFGPGGVLLGGGQQTGQFHGEVSPDGRTWPGRFTSATGAFTAPIFDPGEHSVTLIKQ